MTPENAKKLLPIIEAYANGETIQTYSELRGWVDTKYCLDFSEHPSAYRIKPKPKVIIIRKGSSFHANPDIMQITELDKVDHSIWERYVES